jgi:hypothetical protein
MQSALPVLDIENWPSCFRFFDPAVRSTEYRKQVDLLVKGGQMGERGRELCLHAFIVWWASGGTGSCGKGGDRPEVARPLSGGGSAAANMRAAWRAPETESCTAGGECSDEGGCPCLRLRVTALVSLRRRLSGLANGIDIACEQSAGIVGMHCR